MKKPNIQKMQAECNAFNAKNPIGSDVLVKLDGADELVSPISAGEK